MDKFLLIALILLIITSFIAGCISTSNPKKEIADNIAANIKPLGKIDSSIFDDYSKFQDAMGKINRIIRIVNERLKTQLSEFGTGSSDFEKFRELKTALTYSPLIGPYNDLYDSASLLPNDNDSDYTSFYVNLTRLSIDAAMIESQLSYHVAYDATGIVSRYGLYKLEPYIGKEEYSAILSSIHWTIRGEFENETGKLINSVIKGAENFTI